MSEGRTREARSAPGWMWRFGGLLAVGLVAGSFVGAERGSADGPRDRGTARADAPATPRAQRVRRSLLEGFDPRFHVQDGDRRVSELEGGRRAVLTLDPGLQEHVERVFGRYEVPYGSLVAIEPATGKVLAYVSHSSADPEAGDLCLDPSAPTASVFKVVTGSALVDAGLGANTRTCYTGGGSRLTAWHLEDHADEANCVTLTEAMGRSTNAVFAKLADRHLDGPTIARYASAFGFGHALPFDVPTQASPMEVPDDRLERARTAAGFWHMHLSPLHGAALAATIANDGRMMRPAIVERLENGQGRVLMQHEPEVFRAVLPRRTAQTVNRMMRHTTEHGTARSYFHDEQGNAFLPDITVAGKTGTLSAERPYRGYTWFVGFAPAEDPQIAVATLIVNTPRWRIKAAYAAREALRYYLVEKPRAEAAAAAPTP
ncbi:MAG: penicillin-binding protein [Sandaracinus sp.]|nr:penicillin-binding protein [Sandaracinus sp.]